MNRKNFLAILLLSTISTLSCAKTNFLSGDTTKPKIGKPMPDFTLKDITHYKTKTASLHDFKGKWLFLDFWSIGCSVCIKSFPKVNGFHKEFYDRLNWIMVGLIDSKGNKRVKELYEKFREKRKLEMAAAYDSVLAIKWGIHARPHIIVVDPSGIVRFITDGRDMTVEKVRHLLEGKNVSFYEVGRDRPEFDSNKTDTIQNNNAKNEILYRSVLSKWNGERMSGGMEIDRWITDNEAYKSKGYNFVGVPLYWLYNYAYRGRTYWGDYEDSLYGEVYSIPILEVRDPSLFQHDLVGKGRYNYTLILPPSKITRENVMRAMQEDLKRVFNYSASLETRSIPVWKLVAKPGATDKLKTKGGDRFATPGTHILGFVARNWPANILIGFISFYLPVEDSGSFISYIDETGLAENFDLTLDADMTNIEDVKKAIQKQGLDLVKGIKQMKVLVIRDID